VYPIVTCVCLTTHPKREAFLPDALRSYRQQTYPNRELVVVNDGDPLSSVASDVRVVNLPRRPARWTIGEKRNVGIRYARGEYLATWDDDDVSLPERLADEVSVAETTGASVVLTNSMYVGDEHLELTGRCAREQGKALMPSALIRRSEAVAAGGYQKLDYLEDFSLISRIKHLGRGLVVIIPSRDWYIMRRHGANVTLSAGERNEAYLACAARDTGVRDAVRALERLRSGPGGSDVQPGAGSWVQ
jgi:glycosyltransferase involved in cell wall biosynthesis